MHDLQIEIEIDGTADGHKYFGGRAPRRVTPHEIESDRPDEQERCNDPAVVILWLRWCLWLLEL